MPLDSSLLIKVKEHVTKKLKSLGAFIDEELPDYIMVMVANKKSEASMSKDLQLFLGEHTLEFTNWLHATLEHLKKSDRDKTKSKDPDSKASRRKSNQLASTPSRSRSRSPLPMSKHTTNVSSSREPHGDLDLFHIHAEEDDFTIEGLNTVHELKEKRQIVNTASLNRVEKQDTRVGSSQDSVKNLRSVVKTRQDLKLDRASQQSIRPSGRLIQQAVNAFKYNTQPTEPIRHRAGGDSGVSQRQPADSSLNVTSSAGVKSRLDSTRFYVTLSGDGRPTGIHGTQADSSVGSTWAMDDADDQQILHSTRVNKNVKLRLGQRVSALHRLTRPSAKDRLGPVVYQSDYADVDETDEMNQDVVELVEGDDFDEFELIEAEQGADERSVITTHPGPSRLVDRLERKQLVVRLGDSEEMDEDVVPEVEDATLAKKKRLSAKSNTSDDAVNIPSSLERCRFWPNCRNGEKCPFIHPSEPCPNFPKCRLGATCTYIHPKCRYDGLCNRPDCAYTHSIKRPTDRPAPLPLTKPTVPLNQIVCRYQARCNDPYCAYYHPPAPRVFPTVHPTTAALKNQMTASPVMCRYGASCKSRQSGCPFMHVDVAKPSQLKWVAPSKQSATSKEDDQPTAHATSLPMDTFVNA